MKRTALVFIVLCMVTSTFAQGLYTQSRTEGGAMGERTSEMFVMPKKFKTVEQRNSAAAGAATRQSTIMIIRLDKEVIWQVNPEKRTYSEMTFAQIEAMMSKVGGKMDAAMAQRQELMRNMTEEQRRMMEQAMGSRMPGSSTQDSAPVQVSNTGERKTISGFACTKYTARQGENTFLTMWVSRDVRGFDEMREDWKAVSRRMAAMMPRFGKEMADAYKNIDGFPIQTVMTMMDNTVTTTVTRVERRSTPAGEFEIPSGYTKTKSEMEDAMEKMDEDE